jgi:Zinc dependent phospholipase C
MPAWYVHMEAARRTARRLQAGDVPAGYPISVADAAELGEICHTWRNYLALGAIGPDLFYMLPDYAKRTDGSIQGPTIRRMIQSVLDLWDTLDPYIEQWEGYFGPVSADASQLWSRLLGGVSNQIASILTDLSQAMTKGFEGILANSGDIFGIFSSGPPQAYPNTAFYWADIFHYRRTYQFPFVLYQRGRAALDAATTDTERYDAQTLIAFAIGWLTHCATDVTGHPFTNAKSGGPFRDHWQRHHLVELHLDSQNYSANNTGPHYGQIGESALHFWTAFRERSDGPYAGREDAPAYDYFTGFPAYDLGDEPISAAARNKFFDLDTGDLPDHLVQAILDAMRQVHPDGPKILAQDPDYSATDDLGIPDGRPNSAAMNQMWQIVYKYLKLTGTRALSPRKPVPPGVFSDYSFPSPPGSDYGVSDDPSRGADVDRKDHHWWEFFLAVLAWAIYVVEVVAWLPSVILGLAIDLLAEIKVKRIVYDAEVAAWNLYILARRALVMSGFQMPNPEEIDYGLTTLGFSTGESDFDIKLALDDPLGFGHADPVPNEPSGRPTSTSAFSLDRSYPRNVVRDTFNLDPSLTDLLGQTNPLHYAGDGTVEYHPSAWLAPWRYPSANQAGTYVPQEEGVPVHGGPYVTGDTATVLIPGPLGDPAARQQLEASTSPADTFSTLNDLFPLDKHLGGPVDYGVYLIGRMAAEHANADFGVPDFNLDSDRGYGWKCWDWDRHPPGPPTPGPGDPGEWVCLPDLVPVQDPPVDFHYLQPCTLPHFFHAKDPDGHTDNPRPEQRGATAESQLYDQAHNLRMHYLSRNVLPEPAPDAPDICALSPPAPPAGNDPDWRYPRIGPAAPPRQP